MQVEELGLFSSGKCNTAVEDKLALEVFDLYLKLKKEFDKYAFIQDYEEFKLVTESFETIEKLLENSILITLLPKLNALLSSIKRFKVNRDRNSYYFFTTIHYIVVLNNLLDYLKPMIFKSANTQTDYISELIQNEYYSTYDEKFKKILEVELGRITLNHTIYV